MRVLSLSSRRTLSLLRRVIAPFSVLATRGHAFYFQEVSHFDAAISYGYDVTVLQNWILSDEEYAAYERASRDKTFVYDLSDPLLLQNPRVQEQMQLARLVSVANSYLEKEARVFNPRVRVLPSCIDFELMMLGHHTKSDGTPVIGCFGPHDWGMVKDALVVVKEKHPKVRFLGDASAGAVLGELIDTVQLEPSSYPGYLNTCLFGLCPYDGDHGGETIWGLEYGILSKAIVAARGSAYTKVLPHASFVSSPQKTESWVMAMETMLRDAAYRAMVAQYCFTVANPYRATRKAGEYLSTYEKMLPQLVH